MFNKKKAPVINSDNLLPADLSMGIVTLRTDDVNALSGYYRDAMGLTVITENVNGVIMGRAGSPLVAIEAANGLKLPSSNEAGLYHLAILFKTQADLAATVLRALRFDNSRFVGSSDHLVSEAFYFTDPDGNGIELYWDRSRSDWTWNNGQVAMDTVYLPWDKYLNKHVTMVRDDLSDTAANIGHVHLQVGNIPAAQRFYVEALGFEPTAQLGDKALFVSAGGYHHHIAMNTWNSTGVGPRRNTLGLGSVDIVLPQDTELEAISARLWDHGHQSEITENGLEVRDPWNTLLILSA